VYDRQAVTFSVMGEITILDPIWPRRTASRPRAGSRWSHRAAHLL